MLVKPVVKLLRKKEDSCSKRQFSYRNVDNVLMNRADSVSVSLLNMLEYCSVKCHTRILSCKQSKILKLTYVKKEKIVILGTVANMHITIKIVPVKLLGTKCS